MPAGDSTRAWWPQMIEELKRRWNLNLTWDDCAELCREMTELRAVIRVKEGVIPPRMLCNECKAVHGMEPLPVGIRSMLFALKKEQVLNEEQFTLKDFEWKKYQRKNGLDSVGKPKVSKRENPQILEP